jgi:hypothetical protein
LSSNGASRRFAAKASLLAALLVLPGCTRHHVISISQPTFATERFNDLAKTRDVIIDPIRGDHQRVFGPRIEREQLLWFDAEQNRAMQMPMNELNRLDLLNSRRGAVKGALYGSFAGVAAGIYLVRAPDCRDGCLHILSAPFVLAGVTAASTLLGALVGAATGVRETFVVEPTRR